MDKVVVILAMLFLSVAKAEPILLKSGFFAVGKDRKVHAREYAGDPSKPAVILINGLTQDQDHWDTTIEEILKSGRRVITYDATYQGRSLEWHVETKRAWLKLGSQPVLPPLVGSEALYANQEPIFPASDITQQARELRALMKHFDVDKATLVGLSYGGGLALRFAADYPAQVENLVLLAPYVEPLTEQDQLIRYLVGNYQRAFPMMGLDGNGLYDFFFRALVLATYHVSEPTILKWGPFQSYAAAELARGIRHMEAKALSQKMPPQSVHLVIAGLDAYIQREVLTRFWHQVPEEARASFAVFEGVEHKINESVGPFLGAWVRRIVERYPQVHTGKTFLGVPEKGYIQAVESKEKIALVKAVACENWLKPTHPGRPNYPMDRIARHPGEIFIGYARALMPPPIRLWFDRVTAFWRNQ